MREEEGRERGGGISRITIYLQHIGRVGWLVLHPGH